MSTETPEHVATFLNDQMARLKAKFDAMTPEEREQRQKECDAERKTAQIRRIESMLAAAKAPSRQLKNESVNRDGEWGKAESAVARRIGTGFLIVLIGARGNGKTQLATEIMRRCAAAERGSRYCTAMEFFMEVKASYKSESSESERDVISKFSRPQFLVVDEIGQRSDTEWENRLLYELINRRYNNMTDTLLISNQDATQLEAALGPSITSRIRETGGVVECNWKSFRQ